MVSAPTGHGAIHLRHPVQRARSTASTFESRWIASGGHSGRHRPQRSQTARSTTAISGAGTRGMSRNGSGRGMTRQASALLGVTRDVRLTRPTHPTSRASTVHRRDPVGRMTPDRVSLAERRPQRVRDAAGRTRRGGAAQPSRHGDPVGGLRRHHGPRAVGMHRQQLGDDGARGHKDHALPVVQSPAGRGGNSVEMTAVRRARRPCQASALLGVTLFITLRPLKSAPAFFPLTRRP